jgi:hypothetical protein
MLDFAFVKVVITLTIILLMLAVGAGFILYFIITDELKRRRRDDA